MISDLLVRKLRHGGDGILNRAFSSRAHAPNHFNLRPELGESASFRGGGEGRPEREAPAPLTRSQREERREGAPGVLQRGQEEETGHWTWPQRDHW